MSPLFIAFLISKQDSYFAEIQQWRTQQTRDLKADEGWLTLAGLTWLYEGENSIGADATSAVVLPAGHAPGKVGIFTRRGQEVLFKALSSGVTLNDQPLGDQFVDTKGGRLRVGSVTFLVIVRGKRVGIRFYDKLAKTRTDFPGQRWFPIKSALRIRATFLPYVPTQKVPITNVLGDVSLEEAAGEVEFSVSGKLCHLVALKQGSGLFFNFKDLTNNKETYPAGRFLDAEGPKDGFVILDFNKATNPPCAFTAFATCPLPPRKNFLPVRLEAGELVFHHS